MYLNNEKKFVAILNKKIDLPKLMNALGHITLGLAGNTINKDRLELNKYDDACDTGTRHISKYPYIVLKAKNSNQIRTARKSAIEMGLIYNDFSDKMIGASLEAQMQQMKMAKEEELEYYALVLFGDSDELMTITKKFSLF